MLFGLNGHISNQISLLEVLFAYPMTSFLIQAHAEFLFLHMPQEKYRIYWVGGNLKRISDEQAGMIYGTRYKDSISGLRWMIINEVDPDYRASGTSASVQFRPNKKLQDLLNSNSQPGMEDYYYTLGWFHTHPNNLPVFMSSTDRYTHRLYFPTDDYCAIVINPQKKILRTFMSDDFTEVQTVILESR
jgi:proteasome lid subunit RPN8/RPN11